jgi:hypothetical protein
VRSVSFGIKTANVKTKLELIPIARDIVKFAIWLGYIPEGFFGLGAVKFIDLYSHSTFQASVPIITFAFDIVRQTREFHG